MRKVLIIGGGIGGLTAALALTQRGFGVEVYEAASALQPVGKGIWVPTNAMQVLHRLNLARSVQEAGWPLNRIQLRLLDGRVLMDCDLNLFEAKYGHTTVSIHRAALVEQLANAAVPGTIHLGKRFTRLTMDQSHVVAHFEDGTQAEGDLLIGADGIRSPVREQIFPGVPLRYHGQTCYRGIAEMELPADVARSCWEVWGGEIRLGFSAVGPRQVYWFAPATAPANSPMPTGNLNEILANRYKDFPAPIPEILRRTPASDIIRTDLFDFATIGRWWQGRTVLLGDAAHAMTPNLGQGGAQAIEDAYVLAEQLATRPDISEAFAAYEQLRMPKVRWVVKTAWKLGKMAHVQNRLLQGMRNLVLRLTPAWMNNRQLDYLYALNY